MKLNLKPNDKIEFYTLDTCGFLDFNYWCNAETFDVDKCKSELMLDVYLESYEVVKVNKFSVEIKVWRDFHRINKKVSKKHIKYCLTICKDKETYCKYLYELIMKERRKKKLLTYTW